LRVERASAVFTLISSSDRPHLHSAANYDIRRSE
jgi:hypothetical protein